MSAPSPEETLVEALAEARRIVVENAGMLRSEQSAAILDAFASLARVARTREAELAAEVAALRREVARHVHGEQIEGDYVCPHEVEADQLRSVVADAKRDVLACYALGGGRAATNAALDRVCATLGRVSVPATSP